MLKEKIIVLLTKYSKKYGIDLFYFVKNSLFLLIGQFINSIKGIILILLITNILGEQKLGEYGFIMAIIGIVSVVTLPGSGTAIIQSISRGFEGTYKFLQKKRLLYSMVGSLTLVFIGFFINYFKNFPNSNVFFLIAILFPLYISTGYYIYFLTGKKEFGLRAKYETISSLLIIIGTVISLFLFDNIVYILMALFIVKILSNIIFEIKILKSSNNKIDKEALPYAKRLSLLSVLTMIKIYGDKLLISYYLGFVQTGIYMVAVSINDQIYALGKIIGNLLMPKASNITNEELIKRRKKMILLLGGFFVILSVVLILLYPTFIPLLFGDNFKNAVLYTQILTAFVTIKCVFIVMNLIDQAKKDLKTTVFSNTVSPLVEILLMIILGYYFQIFGIIGARVVGDSMNLTYFLFTKNNKRQCK